MTAGLEGTLRSGRCGQRFVARTRYGGKLVGRRAAVRLRRVTVRRERGDVPGWVMIAVMTAALVVAIMLPFRNTIIPAMTGAIQDMFSQAN
ncbi:MAG: hypothetical protein V7637_5816 [Mycobacteriales bacterium]